MKNRCVQEGILGVLLLAGCLPRTATHRREPPSEEKLPQVVASYCASHNRPLCEQWYVLGPFPTPRDALARDLLLAEGGEAAATPTVRPVTVPPARLVRWRKVEAYRRSVWFPRSLRTRYRGYVPLGVTAQDYPSATAVAFGRCRMRGGYWRLVFSVWGSAQLSVNGKRVIENFSSPEFFAQREVFLKCPDGENRFLVKVVNDSYNRTAQAEKIFGSWGFSLFASPAGPAGDGLFVDIPLLGDLLPGDNCVAGVLAVRALAHKTPPSIPLLVRSGSSEVSLTVAVPEVGEVRFEPFLLPLSPARARAPSLQVVSQGALLCTYPLSVYDRGEVLLRRVFISPSDGTAQLFLLALPCTFLPPEPVLYLHCLTTTEEELLTWSYPLLGELMKEGFAVAAPRAREGKLRSGQAEADILTALSELRRASGSRAHRFSVVATGSAIEAALRLAAHMPEQVKALALYVENPFEPEPAFGPEVLTRWAENLRGMPICLLSSGDAPERKALATALGNAGALVTEGRSASSLPCLPRQAAAQVVRFLRRAEKEEDPHFFLFTTRRLRHGRHRLIAIEGLQQRTAPARCEVTLTPPGALSLRTENTEAVRILTALLPESFRSRLTLTWNGRVVFSGKPPELFLHLREHPEGALRKRKGFEGPLDELLRAPHQAVVPEDPAWRATALRLLRSDTTRARWGSFTGQWQVRCVSYHEARPEDAWLLFGGLKENPLLAARAPLLPIRLQQEAVTVGSQRFSLSEHILLCVCADPLLPRHLIGIFAGRPHSDFAAFCAQSPGNPFARPGDLTDIVIWRKLPGGTFRRVLQAWFSEDWKEIVEVAATNHQQPLRGNQPRRGGPRPGIIVPSSSVGREGERL